MQPTTVGTDSSPHKDPSMSAITGHCLCGAVMITVAGEHDPRVGLCFEANASAVTVTGEVTRFRSSAFAERAFCPRCGSHLWFNDVEDGGEPRSYELMPGLFDAARSWPLRSEIYVDRAMASVSLAGDHRRQARSEYEAEHPFVEGDGE